jgi:arsenate reductase
MSKLFRKLAAEFIGTGVFAASIVGASVTGHLAENFGLVVAVTLGLMIVLFGGVSGGHFNPAVTTFFMVRKELAAGTGLGYIAAQIAGAVTGAFIGGQLWGYNTWAVSNANIANGQVSSEILATAGLVLLIGTLAANKQGAWIAPVVTAWIFAAGSFTSSGAVANPAITIGRMFTSNKLVEIGVQQGGVFILAQFAGVLVALLGFMFITSPKAKKKSKK